MGIIAWLDRLLTICGEYKHVVKYAVFRVSVYPSRPFEDGFARLDEILWENDRLTPVFL